MISATTRTVTVRFGCLAYVERGPEGGVPVVFIHGNSCDKRVFGGQMSSPALQGFRLIAVDLSGHGDSSSGLIDPDTPYLVYSIPYHVESIRAFIQALALPAPIVVGHSLGGHIAVALARQIEIRGLFISQAPPIETPEDISKAFHPLPELGYLWNENLSDNELAAVVRVFGFTKGLPAFLSAAVRQTQPACRRNLRASLVTDPPVNEVSSLATLACPVTIGLCPNDRLINFDYMLGLDFGNKQNLRQVLFPASGHFPQLDEAMAFNQTLLDLARQTGSASRIPAS